MTPDSRSTPTLSSPGGAPVPVPEAGPDDEPLPGTWLGRYQVVRLVGRGGMGSVYEAVHRDLGKRVAIKTLLPALAGSAESRARFVREGQAAARIRHPHVVDVTDVVSQGAVTYLVMEYLEGEDLAARLERAGALSLRETADILLPVVAAIAAAHEHGVIHRDLKPENVFLARTPHEGVAFPKVVDFGISKVLGDAGAAALTATSTSFGTLYYLPPEQLRGAREACARSDQYALATIVYECLTGRRAFDGEGIYGILKSVAEGSYTPARRLVPGLPAAVDAAITRALSLDPAARFASVRALGAVLLDFASDGVRARWAPVCAGGGGGGDAAGEAAVAGGAAPAPEPRAPSKTMILPAVPALADHRPPAPLTDPGVRLVAARSWAPRLIALGIALGAAVVALASVAGSRREAPSPPPVVVAQPPAPEGQGTPIAAPVAPAPVVNLPARDAPPVGPDPSTPPREIVPGSQAIRRAKRRHLTGRIAPAVSPKNDAPIIE